MERSFNLLANIPDTLDHEVITHLVENQSVRIERIISHGHASAPDFWYDQSEHEWVAVLSGKAILQVEGSPEPIQLVSGDTLHLPAHVKHRVDWTDPQQDTIWLAVFWH